MSSDQQGPSYWDRIHGIAQWFADAGDRLNDMSVELEEDVSGLILLALSSDALGLSARLDAFRIQYQPEGASDE